MEKKVMSSFIKEKLQQLSYTNIVTKLLISIIAVSFLETAFSPYKFNTPEFFNSISFGLHLLLVLVIFALLCFSLNEKYNGYSLIILLTSLFVITNYQNQNIFFAIVCSGVLCAFVCYFSKKIKKFTLSKKFTIIVCIILGILFTLFVAGITIIKFLNHRTPNFDFGIFSQMFHYMKETLVPYTTCERDMLLSHFAVHFSPILYLILPFYIIFPHPSILLALQAIIVALGIIPIYKLGKHFNLSNNKIIAITFMYVFHPTVLANNFYYFHENCFLTVLLLFLFYFAEKQKSIPTYIFALLTMFVKEDAPIYVLFFGIYLLLSNKSKIKGSVLCSMSIIYFAVVTKLMSIYGNGIMTYRYDNFIFEDNGSIYSVVLNVIKNPTYVFDQLLKQEKLEFLILMLVPLAFIPFVIKKPSSIALFFPLVLMNFMTDYVYQYNIGFQYTYGTVAFLFYLVIINISEVSPENAKKLLLCGICTSLIFFASVNMYRLNSFEVYANEKEESKVINTTLNSIPKDKSIKSTSFFIPSLWNRNDVYEYRYSDKKTDYVVFDLRWNNNELKEFLSENEESYECVTFENGIIALYKAK